MSSDATLFIGVDPSAGRKPFTYAALDQYGKLAALQRSGVEETLAFIADQPAAIVAVNTPPRPGAGLLRHEKTGKNLDMRPVEYQLRQRGIKVAGTPSLEANCAPRLRAGFHFHRRLESLGFAPFPASEAPRCWLETHPHAVFCVLLGQVPLPRSSLEGRQQRQLILYEQRLIIRDPMEFFEEVTRHKLLKGILPLEQIYTPDELDALAAAYTAYVAGRHPARMGSVGNPQEGQIFLPIAALKEKY